MGIQIKHECSKYNMSSPHRLSESLTVTHHVCHYILILQIVKIQLFDSENSLIFSSLGKKTTQKRELCLYPRPAGGGIAQNQIKALKNSIIIKRKKTKKNKKKNQVVCFCVLLVNVSLYCVVFGLIIIFYMTRYICYG